MLFNNNILILLEKSEVDAKTQSKENQPKKKKKKKASNTAENTNPSLTNGKTHSVNYEADNNALEDSSKSKSQVPTEKRVQQSGLLRKGMTTFLFVYL